LLPSHKYISTVTEEEESTHAHVTQKYLVAPFKSHLSVLAAFIEKQLSIMRKEEGEDGTMKIMVFFPTARSTGFAAELVCS
jgi:ATP-dependent RNA helicase MSS116